MEQKLWMRNWERLGQVTNYINSCGSIISLSQAGGFKSSGFFWEWRSACPCPFWASWKFCGFWSKSIIDLPQKAQRRNRLQNDSEVRSLLGTANWAQRVFELMYSHQGEIRVTQMTEFLSCKPEAEYSATGSEREEKGVGGRESEKKNVGIPMGYRLDAPSPQLQPKERDQWPSGSWRHCSEVRGRNKSREVRFS